MQCVKREAKKEAEPSARPQSCHGTGVRGVKVELLADGRLRFLFCTVFYFTEPVHSSWLINPGSFNRGFWVEFKWKITYFCSDWWPIFQLLKSLNWQNIWSIWSRSWLTLYSFQWWKFCFLFFFSQLLAVMLLQIKLVQWRTVKFNRPSFPRPTKFKLKPAWKTPLLERN